MVSLRPFAGLIKCPEKLQTTSSFLLASIKIKARRCWVSRTTSVHWRPLSLGHGQAVFQDSSLSLHVLRPSGQTLAGTKKEPKVESSVDTSAMPTLTKVNGHSNFCSISFLEELFWKRFNRNISLFRQQQRSWEEIRKQQKDSGNGTFCNSQTLARSLSLSLSLALTHTHSFTSSHVLAFTLGRAQTWFSPLLDWPGMVEICHIRFFLRRPFSNQSWARLFDGIATWLQI